jgi:Na+/H+-dicarboxylate symporter
MMTIVFSSIGIPIEAIAIIAGVDRLLDMFRTSINVAGDLTISKLVDKISRN